MKSKTIRLVLGVVLVVCLLIAAPASATNLWYSGGLWIHQHTMTYNTYNGIDQAGLRDQATNARQEWAGDTNLSLPTSGHASSRIHLVDDHYGNTGWAGLAVSSYHDSHAHAKYNLTYVSGWGATKKRAVACQEIGHLLGMAHGGGDCMAFSYFANWTPNVGSHSISEINFAYAGPH